MAAKKRSESGRSVHPDTLTVRHEQRRLDVVGLERDKQLHPHMLEAEIKSLGWIFDEFAMGTGSEVYIDHRAVQHMLEESLAHLYKKLDRDHSGTLDRSEIKTLLGSLGQPTTSTEMDQLMSELDVDGDEKIDLREFMAWWEHRPYETLENQQRELEDLFAAVDKDGSGRIDWHEFLGLVA